MKRLLTTGLLFALAWAFAQKAAPNPAKKTATAPTKPGIVSGRIFAITKGGDIKPARMANVHLLYYHQRKTASELERNEENSVGGEWLDRKIKATDDYIKELSEDKIDPSSSIGCRKELLAIYAMPLSKIIVWGLDQNKDRQILQTEADEEGNFKIIVPRPGVYILLANGRAGFNEAFWYSLDVLVKPGTETPIKLGSPEKACVVE
jgi:hypothetical protein